MAVLVNFIFMHWLCRMHLIQKYFPTGPQPVLTVSPLWLSPGDSVTLNCELQHPSAGWRFYWYKTVPELSDRYSYSSELLPDSTNGTEQDSYIIHGQTHTAGYKCRAGRGDSVYYTDYSKPKFVWSGDQCVGLSFSVFFLCSWVNKDSQKIMFILQFLFW